ncbi:MAG: PIN domain-containing protein [Thermoleophilaceae bacterium]
MSVATRALLDTSVVIALARGEPLALADPPDEATISVVTLCGLHRGVLVAQAGDRAARLAVLAYAERTFKALAVDERVAPEYGRISERAAEAGRDVRRHLADLLIAATAAANGLLLLTRDRQLDGTPGVETVLV